jgi:hypothetical protein
MNLAIVMIRNGEVYRSTINYLQIQAVVPGRTTPAN